MLQCDSSPSSLSKLPSGLATVSESQCVWAGGADRTVRPRRRLTAVTRVVQMAGTGSVTQTVRANARRSDTRVKGVESKAAAAEEEEHLTFALLNEYQKLRAPSVFLMFSE